ncbi:MAG: hypothetical protein ABSD56_00150 [Bryobacteraceae bacterium]
MSLAAPAGSAGEFDTGGDAGLALQFFGFEVVKFCAIVVAGKIQNVEIRVVVFQSLRKGQVFLVVEP